MTYIKQPPQAQGLGPGCCCARTGGYHAPTRSQAWWAGGRSWTDTMPGERGWQSAMSQQPETAQAASLSRWPTASRGWHAGVRSRVAGRAISDCPVRSGGCEDAIGLNAVYPDWIHLPPSWVHVEPHRISTASCSGRRDVPCWGCSMPGRTRCFVFGKLSARCGRGRAPCSASWSGWRTQASCSARPGGARSSTGSIAPARSSPSCTDPP